MRTLTYLAIAALLGLPALASATPQDPLTDAATEDSTVPIAAVEPEDGDVTSLPMPQSEGQLIVRSGQPAPSGPFETPSSVAELDTNGDGVIDRSEAKANLALWNEFDLADNRDPAARDGRVTQSELSRWQ